MSCGIGQRHSSDPVLLWFWRRLAATAPIRPLAWEPPYAMGVALEETQKDQKTNKQAKIWGVTCVLRSVQLSNW